MTSELETTQSGGATAARATATNLHVSIRRVIEEQVLADLAPGEAIPSERQLAEAHGVSRTTARQAIEGLVRAGRLYRIKGSGTYVSEGGVIEKPLAITSFTEDMMARGMQPSSRIIDFAIGSARDDLSIAEALDLRPSEETILIRRVRIADGIPMAYECTILPYKLVPGLELLDLEGSLYTTLSKRYKLTIDRVRQRIRAISLSEAEAGYLGTDVAASALRFVRIAYDRRGIPLERTVTIYRGDRYEFSVGLTRDGD